MKFLDNQKDGPFLRITVKQPVMSDYLFKCSKNHPVAYRTDHPANFTHLSCIKCRNIVTCKYGYYRCNDAFCTENWCLNCDNCRVKPVILPKDLQTLNDFEDIRKHDLLLISTSRKLTAQDDFRKCEEL